MNRRHFLAAALAPSVAFARPPKQTIKIVSILPRTGGAKVQTESIARAINLAIDEHRWEVAGFALDYLDWDDATAAAGTWTAERETELARNAVKDPDVLAVIGPYNSGAAKVSMPILNDAGLVQVSPACSYPGLTKKLDGGDPAEPNAYRPAKRVTFGRVCPTDEFQGQLAADFAKSELKAKSVYILDDKEVYGEGVATQFEKRCPKAGLKVLGREGIDLRQRDYAALMAKIKEKKPDLLYFGGTTQSQGGQVVRDAFAVLKCPVLLPDGCYEKVFIDTADEASLANVHVTVGGIVPAGFAGRAAAFAKSYFARYRTDPGDYAVYGYEAAQVIVHAIKAAGKKDREAVREAVLATKDFEAGALEKWSFDAAGDTTLQQVTVCKVEKGKFVPVKVLAKA